MKTSELKGAALDWAVAELQADMQVAKVFGLGSVRDSGYVRQHANGYRTFYILPHTDKVWRAKGEGWVWGREVKVWSPSTNWAQGGPIIEQMGKIGTIMLVSSNTEVVQVTHIQKAKIWTAYGATELEACMRCYVASKLGDTVNLPQELAHDTR